MKKLQGFDFLVFRETLDKTVITIQARNKDEAREILDECLWQDVTQEGNEIVWNCKNVDLDITLQ